MHVQVVEALLAEGLVDHRLVPGRPALERTVGVPVAEELARVRPVAVTERDHLAAAARHERRFVEGREVAHDPRAHHHRGDARDDTDQLEPPAPVGAPGERREGQRDEREQEDALGAGQRRERERDTHEQRMLERRFLPHPVPRPHPEHEREGVDGLRADRGVVDPEVRVERGDARADQPGEVAREPPVRDSRWRRRRRGRGSHPRCGVPPRSRGRCSTGSRRRTT